MRAGKSVSHNCCMFLFLQPQIHCGLYPELLPRGCPWAAPSTLASVGHTPSPILRCLTDSVILVSISSSVMISNKNLCCPIGFQGGDRCIPNTYSRWCIAKTITILESNYLLIKNIQCKKKTLQSMAERNPLHTCNLRIFPVDRHISPVPWRCCLGIHLVSGHLRGTDTSSPSSRQNGSPGPALPVNNPQA